MPDTRSSPRQQEIVKKKRKPPACDVCKARRVLCHPTTDGTPCPRCREKGTACTTTPVARGRPPKPYLGVKGIPPPAPSARSTSEVPSSSDQSNVDPELPPELVHHLFDCFMHLPHYNHPMFRGVVLRDALCSVSWKIHQLPPEMKVLAHCICALGSSISFDSLILGPGPKPASLTDPSVFTRRADLRDFGVRRASMYHALCAQALRLACEVGILLEPSEDNAVSCFILQFLENEKNLRSRPWAVAHLSHIRAISESWGPSRVLSEYTLSVWTSLLLLEVLEATHCRRPILVSHYDQLLLTGIGPPSLEIYVASVRSLVADRKQAKLQLLFTIVQPFLFHATELARKLYETITGDFARRHPVDETAVTQLISALNLLHSIPVLLSEEGALDAHFSESLFCPSAETRDAHINMRAAAHIMTFSHASLVLALYRELEHRARDTAPLPVHDGEAPPDHWRAERLALLRRQVRDMAGRTVHEVARGLRALPSLPHIAHIQRGALVAWAEFCLDDPTVTPERAAMMETLSGALKLIGYAWPLPPGLVERLDAASGPALIEDVAATNASFLDMFPAPLDDNWMSMFTMPLGSGGFPEGQFL